MQPHPQYLMSGAAPADGSRREAARFLTRFSDDQLAIVWRFGGFGDGPGDRQARPYPGRHEMARHLRFLPGSWREALRRAVLAAGDRPELAALRALLSAVLAVRFRPSSLPAPAPRALAPQAGHGALAPVRGSPLAARLPVSIPGAPPP